MKANIIVKNLKNNGAAQMILKKVSVIPGLSEINIDTERSKISFNYQSDDAVFSLLNTLKNLGHPYIATRRSMAARLNNELLT
ncbi:MAG: heavy metal transporter [Salegentibacter sp.]|uniref:Heavy-metal-associated domain-containing protein n=1 Tax=Salegentibacter flavus TaxID=287099 RepID=A0A1I5BVD5_9FLAO|nr:MULTISPECIES: hypothetical protein [Salegentibacter]MDR9457841.1 heavy metal transporter [Salegentibacter sp.]SFN78660.1 hypothetical protein SAMN05660413_02565 [Salegentibacter flavus]